MAKVGKSEGSNALAVPSGSSLAAQQPDFMREAESHGLDLLKKYIVPPRLKIVQKQAGEPFSTNFNTGDCVLVPQLTLISPVVMNDKGKPSPNGTPFHIVPIFFYPEWCLWNPIEMKGTQHAIRARSQDPRSDLALKAQRQDTWFEQFAENPPGKPSRYVEHLNFIVTLVGDHPLEGTPFVISFAKGEHRSGSNFAAIIQMRKAPMWGCQFAAKTTHRPNNPKGDWYGLDITNPDPESGVTPFLTSKELYDQFTALHNNFKESHAKGIIQTDYEEPADEVPTGAKSEF